MKNLAYYRDLNDKDNNFEVTDRLLQVNCAGQAVYAHKVVAHTVRRDYYLLYLLRGEIALSEPQKGSSLRPGDMIVFEPGKLFDYRAVSEGIMIYDWVHFSGTVAGELLAQCGIPVGQVCTPGTGEELGQEFLRLFPAFVRRDEFSDLDAASALTRILLSFGRSLQGQKAHSQTAESAVIYRSTAYIHEHLAADLTVEKLAGMAYMSKGHYRALFRKVAGISPMEYIIEHRIRLACDLLRGTDGPVQEIAATVGYGDSHYFTRLFTRKMGITPSAYRKNYR